MPTLLANHMNLLLIHPEELSATGKLVLTDHRHLHLINQLKVTPGKQLEAGILNGALGTAEVISTSADSTQLVFTASQLPPPPPLPLNLVLALPRPRMLARSLENLSALGVKQIYLVNSARVEKSFWQSPELKPEKIHQHLLAGLSQAKDTLLPQVYLRPQFKPFVEDELSQLSANTTRLIAHLGSYSACPRGLTEAITLMVGPEGGWVNYEVELAQSLGFSPVQLGRRILRVETALVALISRLF